MVGLTGGVSALEGDVGGHLAQPSRVAAVTNYFGVTDIPEIIGQPGDLDRTSPDAPEVLLLGAPVLDQPASARMASPVNHVTSDDPPVLTLHGTGDRIVPHDQAERLHEALTRAGVTSYFITVNKGGHGGFPDNAEDRTATFFSKVLLDEDVVVPTEPLNLPGLPPP